MILKNEAYGGTFFEESSCCYENKDIVALYNDRAAACPYDGVYCRLGRHHSNRYNKIGEIGTGWLAFSGTQSVS